MRQRDLYIGMLLTKLRHFTNKFKPKIQIGDRLKLSDGYEYQPSWLQGTDFFLGTVSQFIEGQNSQKAMVVTLDHAITVDGNSGSIVVLELRHVGGLWIDVGIVHIELCNSLPNTANGKTRKRGVWIESHASYEKLNHV